MINAGIGKRLKWPEIIQIQVYVRESWEGRKKLISRRGKIKMGNFWAKKEIFLFSGIYFRENGVVEPTNNGAKKNNFLWDNKNIFTKKIYGEIAAAAGVAAAGAGAGRGLQPE